MSARTAVPGNKAPSCARRSDIQEQTSDRQCGCPVGLAAARHPLFMEHWCHTNNISRYTQETHGFDGLTDVSQVEILGFREGDQFAKDPREARTQRGWNGRAGVHRGSLLSTEHQHSILPAEPFPSYLVILLLREQKCPLLHRL